MISYITCVSVPGDLAGDLCPAYGSLADTLDMILNLFLLTKRSVNLVASMFLAANGLNFLPPPFCSAALLR